VPEEQLNLLKLSTTSTAQFRACTAKIVRGYSGNSGSLGVRLGVYPPLIDRGADVNAQNAFGSTALMWSVSESAKVSLLRLIESSTRSRETLV
jgi:ankyrin repeat protein